jgi:hypothetical protein
MFVRNKINSKPKTTKRHKWFSNKIHQELQAETPLPR